MTTVVVLTVHEVRLAAFAGTQRQLENLEREDAHGFNGDGWGAHIEGAAAELAFARSRGHYWAPVVEDFTQLPGDVARVQVRSTVRPDGCLITHPSDPDDAPFVLMVGRIPSFRIAGWIYGKQAKQQCFWRTDTGRPAYFVPQRHLRPV